MTKPILIIIAGPNGSGKTSITSKILKHEWVESCEYINPDNIANDVFGDWNSQESILKAAQLASQLREKYIKEGRSLIFETVLSADVIKSILFFELKRKGILFDYFLSVQILPQLMQAELQNALWKEVTMYQLPKLFRDIANPFLIAASFRHL